jgi:predicted TIM-barrel fold metal-dependent hydrolase
MDPADQIIDVWMQHPTPSFIGHPMFESLRRWMGMDWPAAEIPNVYIDTSAYKAKRFPPELIAYMRAHGRRKVLFGTNYPMITPQMALEGLDGLGLDEEARRLFLYGNAQRIFSL